jgi:hypothetical protein
MNLNGPAALRADCLPPEITLGRIHCNTWASPAVIIGYVRGAGSAGFSPISAKMRQNYAFRVAG